MNHDAGEHEPKYNLGWVIRQTGLTADTIRVWEKRYGVPNPQRTPGNQRLYSEYDIQQLNWLHAKTEAGIQISKAVAMWLEQDGQPSAPAAQSIDQTNQAHDVDEMQRLQNQWVQACLAMDDQAASQVLNQAFSIFSHPQAARFVVFEGVKTIEDLWLSGKRSSHYLHYARQAASRKVFNLMGAYPAAAQSAGTLVLATVMEEEDPLRPVYLSYLARMAGWKTVNAGPQMIMDPLYQTMLQTHASALILVANHLHTAANAYGILKSIQKKNLPIFFCGTFFERHSELQMQFPGVFLEEPWEERIMGISNLMDVAQARQGQTIDPSCQQILSVYQMQRIQIEQISQQMIPAKVLQDQHFAMANYFMQRGITAAMMLGNLTYLEEDLVWIHRLLSNMGFGPAVMPAYARTYQAAIEQIGKGKLAPLSAALTSAIELMH
ncbi:MAG: MerR family transcriptional regulator [Anaerolineaceae bacterium]|nr:MerR family transcriptional regulator [Anaerolineaceae bacterium]